MIVFTVILWTLSVIYVSANLRCNPNVNTPGATYPKGDIYVQVGGDLDILCMLNSTHPQAYNKNSSQLVFYNATDSVPPTRVSSQYVTIVNETTIRLQMKDIQKSKSIFYCKIKDSPSSETLVCFNTVFIDTPPQDVTNFSCVSHNWNNLTCSWKKPHHYVTTKYELLYRNAGASMKTYYTCPASNATEESCSWDILTTPNYPHLWKEFIFRFKGSNEFGNSSQRQIKFMHFQNIIPSPPIKIEVSNITTNSAVISWQPEFPMQDCPSGLIHRVEYLWEGQKEWKQVDTSHIPKVNNPEPRLMIENLEYPNTAYDVRVYMRSAVAVGKDFWSKPSYKTFRTLPTKPKRPPKVDIGSFQIENSRKGKRDLYIYWQELKEREFSGGNFSYLIYRVASSDEEVLVKPADQTKTYAKFVGFPTEEIKFRIYSSNNEGRSDASEIIVPAESKLLDGPLSFTKIAYDKQSYELSWIAPPHKNKGSFYYTLFWCSSNRDRPYQCNGYLNWTHISDESFAQNITVPTDEIYQFAISKNSVDGTTSGMIWSSCTVIKNIFNRMNNVYIRSVDAHSIVVDWQLGCSDRVGVVRGFIVYYCPVRYGSFECKEPQMNATVNDPSATSFNVTRLRAYTSYKLNVAVLTMEGSGEPSMDLLNTTLASAPSKPPQILTITDLTNTSVTFTWKKPSDEESNGKIISYQYCLNSSSSCETINESSGETQISSVTGLEPYTSYSLTMRARTNAWSNNSTKLVFVTDIGNPDKIAFINLTYVNNSVTQISWYPPKKPGGYLDGYEIKIKYPNNNEQVFYESCRSTTNCFAELKLSDSLNCEDQGSSKPILLIRAYNLITDNTGNTTFYGDWSKEEYLPCISYIVFSWTLFLMFFSMFLIPLLYYLGQKVYKMATQDIPGVKLPPGLEDLENTKTHFTSQSRITNDYKPSLFPDQEHLIHPKKSESENEFEGISVGSRDTQISDCRRTISTSEGSEIGQSSNASTPPMQHNALMSSLAETTATLLKTPDPKPSESNPSYVIIADNNAIIQNTPHTQQSLVNKMADYEYNALEIEDASLPSDVDKDIDLSAHVDAELLRYSSEPEFKFSELCQPMLQKVPSLQSFDTSSLVPSLNSLVISTNSETEYKTVTTTANGYQILPISSVYSHLSPPTEAKPSISSVVSPTVSAMVINTGSSGYVTVSCNAVKPSESSNCV